MQIVQGASLDGCYLEITLPQGMPGPSLISRQCIPSHKDKGLVTNEHFLGHAYLWSYFVQSNATDLVFVVTVYMLKVLCVCVYYIAIT